MHVNLGFTLDGAFHGHIEARDRACLSVLGEPLVEQQREGRHGASAAETIEKAGGGGFA